ncbi:MAG: carboxypeptidase-like regulatory domain-containing protein [Acidobacteriaceae bacterium]
MTRSPRLRAGYAMRPARLPKARGTWLVCAALLFIATAVPVVRAQDFGVKQLNGKVLGAQDAPLSGAIVYLENSRNNDIKSYITENDGGYHFANLSADTDYTLWAAYKGKKSATKTISSFDTRKQVFIDLHIKQ